MFEIFRIQLGQILGGKMKWLVVVVLLLPVLLTAAAVGAGVRSEVERALDEERARQELHRGNIPATAKEFAWEGEDLELYHGYITLRKDGLYLHDERLGADQFVVIQDGYFIAFDGRFWIDETRADSANHWALHITPTDALDPSARADLIPTIGDCCTGYLFLLYPQILCLLVALFYGTSVLGHELGGKTLTYLFTRPLPRWKFVVGKYLGILVALLVPTCSSLSASWLLLGAEGGGEVLLALLVGTTCSLLAFTALCVLIGFLIPRRAMIVALLYGLIFEVFLSFVPALVNQFTITHYVRSIGVRMLDVEFPAEVQRWIGDASVPASVLALAATVVGALTLSAALAARREYIVNDQA